LAAQAAYVLVDRAVERLPAAPGDQLEQVLAPDDLIGVVDQGLEQLKLRRGQVDRLAARRGQGAPGEVEPPAGEAHHGGRGGAGALSGPAQHAAHAGEQFAQMERLGDVVVGADLEADGAVDRVALAGQDHDADVRSLAEEAGQAAAVLAGHGEVDQGEVDALAAHQVAKRRRAVRGADAKALAGEIGAEPVAQQPVVVDDDDVVGQSESTRRKYRAAGMRPLSPVRNYRARVTSAATYVGV